MEAEAAGSAGDVLPLRAANCGPPAASCELRAMQGRVVGASGEHTYMVGCVRQRVRAMQCNASNRRCWWTVKLCK